MKRHHLHFFFFIGLLGVLFACESTIDNGTPEIKYISAEDFQDTSNVSIRLEDGFSIDLWAPGPLLSNAVGLSIDNQGIAYVSETNRRKSSDLDIRQHRDWMTEDLGLQTIEDTEAFHMEKLATSLSDQNSWMEDFNGDSIRDYRDLMVQSENIRKVWDSDGDGRADASNLFAQNFKDMLTGVAGGILKVGEEIFLTAAPDLWKVKDLDGDGDADEQESISYGYGIHIAYAGHDMSGLTMGPDGKIYWSIGDIGVNVVDKTGKRWAYPNEGAVMRCNLDGSDFEVFAHGLRNPQELAFNAYGDLISVDNDGDHPGERERFVHILQGSDTGWRINWQYGKYNRPNESYKIWMDEKLYLPQSPGRPAYYLPPLGLAPDGPAGLAYNPGTALGPQWNDFFFGSYFKGSAARSQIQAFRLENHGASYKIAETQDVLKGLATTGATFGPDGALYINDWKDGYAKKPEGRIWKLDVSEQPNPQRTNTATLLREGPKKLPTSRLQELLSHEDMRVRMMSQFELVRKGEEKALLETLGNSKDTFGRLHAVWGLGQLLRSNANVGESLLPFLKDPNTEVIAQIAKVLGDAQYLPAADDLLIALNSESQRTKYFVFEALGKLGEQRVFDSIIDALEVLEESDPHLRHGLCYALAQLGMEEEIAALAVHPSKFVRIGAVVSLRHSSSPKITEFLYDEDPWVLAETASAIHDDESIPEALPALAEALTSTKTSSVPFLRRAINANLRLATASNARRLAAFSLDEEAPLDMRKDALWALGYWEKPPVLDRVDGRHRKEIIPPLEEGQAALLEVVAALFDHKELKTPAIETVGRLRLREKEEEVYAFFEAGSRDIALRRTSLQALARLKSPLLTQALNVALESRDLALRTDAQSLLIQSNLPEKDIIQMLSKILDIGNINEQQKAINSLSQMKSQAVEPILAKLLGGVLEGKIDPALSLDVSQAVSHSNFDELKSKLKTYEAQQQALSPLEQYKDAMYGGDIKKGRDILTMNDAAQCLRCHQIREYGGNIGPELTRIARNLNPEEMLKSLIDPSARLAPGYGTIVLELKDGTKVSGIIERNTNRYVVLQNAEGVSKRYNASQIANKTLAPSSMLDMKAILKKEEIRDLMAFMMTLK